MATRTTTTSAPRLSRGPVKALAVAALAALAILVAVAAANWWPDGETSASTTPETPVAVPAAVNDGVPPRGGLIEAIDEQQTPSGGPPCEGPSELTGIC